MNAVSPSQVWLITGSSRGFGRALTEAALSAGHRVVATARDPKRLSDFVERYGEQVRAVALDVTDADAAMAAVQTAIDAFGRIDVLVNNAGFGNVAPIEDTSLEDFRDQIETNLFGVINVTKAVIPVMRQQHSGHIFQFSSVGGRIGPPGRAPYAAAKFGVEGFSEVLAQEMNPLGVRVTIIEPGAFRTDFAGSSAQLNEGRPEYAASVGAMVRRQRDLHANQAGDPAKAAAIILYLATLAEPPLRLVLGKDAADAAEKNDLAKIELGKRWRRFSDAADFGSAEQPWS